MYSFSIKQNDTLPVITLAFDDFEEDDLASIFFSFKKKGETVSTSVVAELADGILSYAWQEGDTEEPGEYYGEFVVITDEGGRMTIPSDTYIQITILPSLSALGS